MKAAVFRGLAVVCRYVEIPAWMAAGIGGIYKGASHKYIRRVPKPGGGYRYFYRVTGGHGLAHDNEIVAGAAFKMTHDGKEGHFHVVSVDGGKVTIRHDESGRTETVDKAALRSMLHEHHAEAIKSSRERIEREKAAAEKHGASAKAKAKIQAELEAHDKAFSGKPRREIASTNLLRTPDPWSPKSPDKTQGMRRAEGFASRDPDRKELALVQVKDGVAYASDGHRLIATPTDAPDGAYRNGKKTSEPTDLVATFQKFIDKHESSGTYLLDAEALHTLHDISALHHANNEFPVPEVRITATGGKLVMASGMEGHDLRATGISNGNVSLTVDMALLAEALPKSGPVKLLLPELKEEPIKILHEDGTVCLVMGMRSAKERKATPQATPKAAPKAKVPEEEKAKIEEKLEVQRERLQKQLASGAPWTPKEPDLHEGLWAAQRFASADATQRDLQVVYVADGFAYASDNYALAAIPTNAPNGTYKNGNAVKQAPSRALSNATSFFSASNFSGSHEVNADAIKTIARIAKLHDQRINLDLVRNKAGVIDPAVQLIVEDGRLRFDSAAISGNVAREGRKKNSVRVSVNAHLLAKLMPKSGTVRILMPSAFGKPIQVQHEDGTKHVLAVMRRDDDRYPGEDDKDGDFAKALSRFSSTYPRREYFSGHAFVARWAAVPAWMAASIAGLHKGAAHKYIRRVPKPGGGYRYFYRVTGGHGLAHDNEIVAGAAFKMTHDGKEGHFHVVSVDGMGPSDKVTIRHDESGRTETIERAALRSMLREHHAEAIKGARERIEREKAAAEKNNATPKAKAKIQAELEAHEHAFGRQKHSMPKTEAWSKLSAMPAPDKATDIRAQSSYAELVHRDELERAIIARFGDKAAPHASALARDYFERIMVDPSLRDRAQRSIDVLMEKRHGMTPPSSAWPTVPQRSPEELHEAMPFLVPPPKGTAGLRWVDEGDTGGMLVPRWVDGSGKVIAGQPQRPGGGFLPASASRPNDLPQPAAASTSPSIEPEAPLVLPEQMPEKGTAFTRHRPVELGEVALVDGKWHTVIGVRKERYWEGLSMGYPQDEGVAWRATTRPATLEEAKVEAKHRNAVKAYVAARAELISLHSQLPEGTGQGRGARIPSGEKLNIPNTGGPITGTDYFVIADDGIYAVRHNYDDDSSVIKTPPNAELEAKLRSLVETLNTPLPPPAKADVSKDKTGPAPAPKAKKPTFTPSAAPAPQAASKPATPRDKLASAGLKVEKIGRATVLTGNTYNHKEKIKLAGGRWNGEVWTISPAGLEKLKGMLKSLAPTPAQAAAGNYKKTHRRFAGLDITIENPAGSTRSGVDANGKPWSTTMQADYGYIKRTRGADGDHADVYLGPDENAPNAYIVHQVDPDTGLYDEDKVMLGYDSAEHARRAFMAHYNRRGFFGDITEMPIEQFREKVTLTRVGIPVAPDAAHRVAIARHKAFVRLAA